MSSTEYYHNLLKYLVNTRNSQSHDLNLHFVNLRQYLKINIIKHFNPKKKETSVKLSVIVYILHFFGSVYTFPVSNTPARLISESDFL